MILLNTILWFYEHIVELLVALSTFVAIHCIHESKRYGLPVWPVIGMLPALISGMRTNVYEWFTEVLCQKNGTFTFKGPSFSNLHCVITTDPRNVEHILRTKFNSYPKGHYFHETVRDLLGDGIFSADNTVWQWQRKMMNAEFRSAKFKKLTADSLHLLVHSRLLPVLKNAVINSVAIDLQDVLLRLTFDNICMIAFGEDSGCLRPQLLEIPFARAFEDATETTMLRFVTPTWVWRAMKYFDLGTEKNLRRSINEVGHFVQLVIEARKKELQLIDHHDIEKEKSDFLTAFILGKDGDGKPFSDKFLRDICVNVILAGRDTSSVAMTWFFWLLGQHPSVEDQIVREIQSIVRDIQDRECFTLEDTKKMNYLHAALSESLRLYPSVPMDHKEVVEDDALPDGTVLKKGTKVIYAIYAMGRMKEIWGEDAYEFKPERWLRDGRFASESACKFTAFNAGPRICLGKEFAYHQMKYVVASILCNYHVKVTKNHPVEPKLALTMYMKHGLMVNLFPRT